MQGYDSESLYRPISQDNLLKLFLGMVPSASAGNVTTRVTRVGDKIWACESAWLVSESMEYLLAFIS